MSSRRNHRKGTLNPLDRRALVTDEATSTRLGRIRQRDTAPELAVRQMVSALGQRFRVSNRDLPGSPDLANRRKKWAIFVHGCYWHSHIGCERATVPKRNREFWEAKFAANRARDARVIQQLEALMYRTLVIWECESNESNIVPKLRTFFERGSIT